jgi:hypothetical protein
MYIEDVIKNRFIFAIIVCFDSLNSKILNKFDVILVIDVDIFEDKLIEDVEHINMYKL